MSRRSNKAHPALHLRGKEGLLEQEDRAGPQAGAELVDALHVALLHHLDANARLHSTPQRRRTAPQHMSEEGQGLTP
jgi:hypothetical protein